MDYYIGRSESPAATIRVVLATNARKPAEVVQLADGHRRATVVRIRGGANYQPDDSVVITNGEDAVAVATAIGLVHLHNLDLGGKS